LGTGEFTGENTENSDSALKSQEIFRNFFLGDLVNFHQNEKSPGWWAEA